jgi:hypothetical protein
MESSSKLLASVFWDKDGILLVDYLEEGATITAKHYVAHLDKLKRQLVVQTSKQAFERNLVSSRQCCSSQGGQYTPEIGRFSILSLKRPAYSPDLAPSSFYLFPNLKKHLKGRKFSNIEEATLAVDEWLAAQQK